jgi:hypothetical protein
MTALAPPPISNIYAREEHVYEQHKRKGGFKRMQIVGTERQEAASYLPRRGKIVVLLP